MPKTDRPNIVLLVADQWRAKEVGHCGNPVIKTPCIDALAAEGAGFKKCFVQNPVSTPSRVSMVTGWYPHVCGHRTMHYMARAHEPNMLLYFKRAGYHVWWGGKNDMLALDICDKCCDSRISPKLEGKATKGEPWKLGDKHYHTFLWGKVEETYGMSFGDDSVMQQAVEFVRNPAAEPFFMLVNQTLPHPPYAIHEPFFSMYDRAEVPMPIMMDKPFEGKPEILRRVHERMGMDKVDENDLREIAAVFYGMITKVDRNFGWLIDALKETGRWDNTVVVATSDHGDFAGDYLLTEKMQNTFEDVLTNVPFAIRVPGVEPLPAPSDALIEMIDLLPTLLELAGIELGHTQFGRSLVPLIRGETNEHREYVFCEGGALETEIHTHETDRPKENIYWSRPALQFTEPRVHGKAVMIRSKKWKYVRRLYDTDELYDMENDPDEVHNLINDPSKKDVINDLVATMCTWFIETGDVVPWRWDLRSPGEKHPPWSEKALQNPPALIP